VARVNENKASSTKSLDDASKQGAARAARTLKNVKATWSEHQEVVVDDKGEVGVCRVQLGITFVFE
jgi:flavin-binding protein dodecin